MSNHPKPKRVRISTPESRAKARLAAKSKYDANPEKFRQRSAEYRTQKGDEHLARRREWHEENRDRLIIQKRERYQENKEQILIAAKKYRDENPEKRKAAWDKWFSKNKERRKGDWAAWYSENSGKFSDSTKTRRATDPVYMVTGRIRSTTSGAFRRQGFKKNSKTAAMIGCSWEHLKIHIERQFKKGMNWDNRHLWHIDHIVPLASARDVDELARLSHFSNLQPLWKGHNLSKGDKIVTCQPELTISMI